MQLLAADDAFGGSGFDPVDQEPIIVGKPGQLFALRRPLQAIDEHRLSAFENQLFVFGVVFTVLAGTGALALLGGLDDLDFAVGDRLVERRIGFVLLVLVFQESFDFARRQ